MLVTDIVMLLNPTSGKGRGRKKIPLAWRRMRELGLDVKAIMGTDAQDARAKLRQEIADGARTVVVCGGDGTIHLALQEIVGHDIRLGIIPLGTGDDIARAVGVPLDDEIAAVDVIAAGHTRAVDVARAVTADGTERFFLAVLSAGFDSKVTERANLMRWPTGQSRYLIATIAELGVFQPVDYTLTIDGQTQHLNGMMIAVGNGPSYGGGMRVCPAAEIDDGVLDVTFSGLSDKVDFLKTFPSVFQGTHVDHPSVSVFRGTGLRIEGADQVAYADGEHIGPLPVDIEVRPASLQVLSPEGSGT